MKLKRIYKPDPAAAGRPALGEEARQAIRRQAGRKEIAGAEAAEKLGLVLDRVEVLRAKAKQNFSTRLVEQGAAEGWLTLGRGRIVLHGPPETAYRIVRGPGHYCCHCGLAQPGQAEAQAHVAQRHSGAASPDAANPAGYCRLNHYEGALEGEPV